MLYGALEAGGTKMVCAVGDENGKIHKQTSIPTVSPQVTIPQIIDYFKAEELKAVGIGCFGPIDLKRASGSYGYITSTPKLPWRNYNIVSAIGDALKLPVGFDTDVNASLLGELCWGAAQGLTDAVYITIGTGIGGGVLSGGKLLHGAMHAELGHMLIEKEKDDDYEGKCPYHGACFEGLASGPAIEARYGKSAKELSEDTRVWELESKYIAKALVNLIMTLSPQRIILGGGVMHQTQLFPMIRARVTEYLNGYLDMAELHDMDSYIVPAGLGDDQGIMGAVKLAMEAAG